jgi:hypothetical protein
MSDSSRFNSSVNPFRTSIRNGAVTSNPASCICAKRSATASPLNVARYNWRKSASILAVSNEVSSLAIALSFSLIASARSGILFHSAYRAVSSAFLASAACFAASAFASSSLSCASSGLDTNSPVRAAFSDSAAIARQVSAVANSMGDFQSLLSTSIFSAISLRRD